MPVDAERCPACDGTRFVCSDDDYRDGVVAAPSHDGLRPWSGYSTRADACDHGGGMPCPRCRPDVPAVQPLTSELRMCFGICDHVDCPP